MPTQGKIIDRATLAPLAASWRAEGKIVGFTSGTFDLLHPGHISYLEEAKKQCDILIVGINSDASVKRYKDPQRPIVPADARARVVAGLASVDHVFVFDEETNAANIEALKPSIYMKGGDYTKEMLTSAPLVERYGGTALVLPMEEEFSTTRVIEEIVNRYRVKNPESK
jgi:D-beta-D-heptose 7-phosphate kinase / D-beta-D-heptose 1-phosphate adenosyltransferase